MKAQPEMFVGADASVIGWLSIIFSGPLLFIFPAERRNSPVEIVAPFCPYHEAGFFYSANSQSETDLWLKATEIDPSLKDCDRVYSISGSGIQPNPDKPIILSPNRSQAESLVGILNFDYDPATSVRRDKALFRLSVPKPTYIYPLYHDMLEIVNGYETEPTGNVSEHFTGLRFFYPWDPTTPVTLTPPAGQTPDITPPTFSQLPTVADIEVRYEGLNLTDRNDPHSDSRSCFASLTTLIGAELWLNYNDGKSSPTNPSRARGSQGSASILIHSGADCHAPVITLGL